MLLRCLTQSIPKLLERPVRYFSKSGRNWTLPTETVKGKEELVKDILLYRHERPRIMMYISIFAFFQGTLWTLLGRNLLDMKDLPVETNESTPFWKSINWGSTPVKSAMAATSFLIATLSLTIGSFYVIRSVRYIVLRKNREMVTVVTFTPFGRNRFIDVPLNQLSCQGSRTGGGNMPLKIKGRWFMFIVDTTSGVFPNTKLFDQTVGIYRKL